MSIRLTLALAAVFISFDAVSAEPGPLPPKILMSPQAPPVPVFVPPQVPAMPPAPPLPTGSVASLFTVYDYPEAALEELEQGALIVELSVSAEGRAAACRIVESSDSVSIDAATCRILTRRARFRPARDAAGRPIADRVQQKVRWEIASLPFEPIDSVSVGQFSAVGLMEKCRDEKPRETCSDPDFDMRDFALALVGPLPVSSQLVRVLRFVPRGQVEPHFKNVARLGDRQLYSGSAEIALNRNGKVIECVETVPPVRMKGALCNLIGRWLFAIDPDRNMSRRGEWSVTIFSRPSPSVGTAL